MKKQKSQEGQCQKSEKKSFRIGNQKHEKIISKDELKKKGGVTGNKQDHFAAYLKSYFTEHVHHNYENNLTGLAKSIYQKKYFYMETREGYKLLTFRAIEDYLHQLSKEVQEEIKREKEEKLKYKSRK